MIKTWAWFTFSQLTCQQATPSDEKEFQILQPQNQVGLELMMGYQNYQFPHKNVYWTFFCNVLLSHVCKNQEIAILSYVNANFENVAQETKTIINFHQNYIYKTI
jgi:hypothetical protein